MSCFIPLCLINIPGIRHVFQCAFCLYILLILFFQIEDIFSDRWARTGGKKKEVGNNLTPRSPVVLVQNQKHNESQGTEHLRSKDRKTAASILMLQQEIMSQITPFLLHNLIPNQVSNLEVVSLPPPHEQSLITSHPFLHLTCVPEIVGMNQEGVSQK